MKAIVIREFATECPQTGGCSAADAEAGEIVIKVHAATVNQTLDVALRAGTYARRPPLPHVPGSDAAGEVAAVADVNTLKPRIASSVIRLSAASRMAVPDCSVSTPGGLTRNS